MKGRKHEGESAARMAVAAQRERAKTAFFANDPLVLGRTPSREVYDKGITLEGVCGVVR